MKWLRRSAYPHRLNLFYLANDVIQNCKRKNAIVFRESFADVLPEAAALVKDPSVSKSIERIFKIWEDRNVYPEEMIMALREALSKYLFYPKRKICVIVQSLKLYVFYRSGLVA